MLHVIFIGSTLNENVIEEHQYNFYEQGSKGGVHSFLKHTRSTSQAECHHTKFKMANMSLKSSLELLPRLKQNLIVEVVL
jgi:hypothetical protein